MVALNRWAAVCGGLAILAACSSSPTPSSPLAGEDGGGGDAGAPAMDAPNQPTPDGGSHPSPEAATGDSRAADTAADNAVADGATADDTPITGCGEFSGDTNFTCSMDGNSRGECINGAPNIEACSRGCLREPAPQDSVCLGTSDNWSCPGSYGTQRALDGDYDITSFGCWVDPSNAVHTDPGDNCIPSCLNQAIASGLCASSDDGPSCEERVNWYTADGARFGCLQRVRVTNPATGKSVIAVALDFGPSCSVEAMVSKAVLDSSGRVNLELFGGDQGVSDQSLVHVVEVDNSTPLGPVP